MKHLETSLLKHAADLYITDGPIRQCLLKDSPDKISPAQNRSVSPLVWFELVAIPGKPEIREQEVVPSTIGFVVSFCPRAVSFVFGCQLGKFALIVSALCREIGSNAKFAMGILLLDAVPLQLLSGFCPVTRDDSVSGFINSWPNDLVPALSSCETFGLVIITGVISGTE